MPLAEHLATHGELELPAGLKQQLGEIRLTTVRERLQRFRQDEPQRHRRPPGPRNRALADIPTTRLPWDEAVPGYFEVDLVWHSSPTAQGEFGHTLQMMDVTSGWSERVALLGRSYRVMEAGFKRLLERVPFTVLGIHPDNGTEFFNHHLRTFWTQYPQVKLSRSHPYHKNDHSSVTFSFRLTQVAVMISSRVATHITNERKSHAKALIENGLALANQRAR